MCFQLLIIVVRLPCFASACEQIFMIESNNLIQMSTLGSFAATKLTNLHRQTRIWSRKVCWVVGEILLSWSRCFLFWRWCRRWDFRCTELIKLKVLEKGQLVNTTLLKVSKLENLWWNRWVLVVALFLPELSSKLELSQNEGLALSRDKYQRQMSNSID